MLGPDLANRDRSSRPKGTPLARKSALDERHVELARIGHRKKLRVKIHILRANT
jgi:hypothetical protein